MLQKLTPGTVDDLIAWLELKDPEQRYSNSIFGCLVYHYASDRYQGTFAALSGAAGFWKGTSLSDCQRVEFPDKHAFMAAADIGGDGLKTYGAALERVRKTL